MNNPKPRCRAADDMMPASLATCRANIMQLQTEGAFSEATLAGRLDATISASTNIAFELATLCGQQLAARKVKP